jgi:hypothetical protein
MLIYSMLNVFDFAAPAHSRPRWIGNSYTSSTGQKAKGESSIFYVAPADEKRPSYREICPKWVNPDRTVRSQVFVLTQDSEGSEGLAITGEFTISFLGRVFP